MPFSDVPNIHDITETTSKKQKIINMVGPGKKRKSSRKKNNLLLYNIK